MDWDDEDYNGHDNMNHASHRNSSLQDRGAEAGLDPMDIANPASAYLFLSDDAQDEITGSGKTKMKCLSCGHRFKGEFYESCPKCDSNDTDEELSIIDDEEETSGRANMKCLDCGHTFVGEIYDRCPECFSTDTEVITDEGANRYW